MISKLFFPIFHCFPLSLFEKREQKKSRIDSFKEIFKLHNIFMVFWFPHCNEKRKGNSFGLKISFKLFLKGNKFWKFITFSRLYWSFSHGTMRNICADDLWCMRVVFLLAVNLHGEAFVTVWIGFCSNFFLMKCGVRLSN